MSLQSHNLNRLYISGLSKPRRSRTIRSNCSVGFIPQVHDLISDKIWPKIRQIKQNFPPYSRWLSGWQLYQRSACPTQNFNFNVDQEKIQMWERSESFHSGIWMDSNSPLWKFMERLLANTYTFFALTKSHWHLGPRSSTRCQCGRTCLGSFNPKVCDL